MSFGCVCAQVCELEVMLVHHLLAATRARSDRELIKAVQCYRAGYSKDERRVLERAIFNGEVKGM